MSEAAEVFIPLEYQQYVFKALEIIKAGFIGTFKGTVSSLQWSVVLSIGFAAGLLLYLALGAAAGLLVRTQLKKLKLYVDVTLPKPKPLPKVDAAGAMRPSGSGVPVPVWDKSVTAAAGAAGSPTQLAAALVKEGDESKE